MACEGGFQFIERLLATMLETCAKREQHVNECVTVVRKTTWDLADRLRTVEPPPATIDPEFERWVPHQRRIQWEMELWTHSLRW